MNIEFAYTSIDLLMSIHHNCPWVTTVLDYDGSLMSHLAESA